MKLFISLLFFISLLNAQEYPKFFAKLGTPLFKADPAFQSLATLTKTQKLSETYHQHTLEVLNLANFLKKDPMNLEINRKRYVQNLRTLQKEHDEIMEHINAVLIKSIDADNYKTFSNIAGTELKALRENEIILKRSMAYYVSHRTRGIVETLEPFFQNLSSDKNLFSYVKNDLPKLKFLTDSFVTGGSVQTILLSKNEKTAFIAAGKHCFKALDIQDAQAISEIGAFEFESNNCKLENISLSSDKRYAYLSDLKNGFAILDVSQAKEPLLIGRYPKLRALDSGHYKNNKVSFVIRKKRGLSILDTTDKNYPKLLANYSHGLNMRSLLIDEKNQKIYLTHDKGLSVIDISVLGNPRCITKFEVEGGSFDISYSKKKEVFYLASGDKGVHVLDIQDREIILLSTYQTLNKANALILNRDENILFISSLEGGVSEVNALDSKYLKHIITYQLKNKAKAYRSTLNRTESRLYVSYGEAGLVIIKREQ